MNHSNKGLAHKFHTIAESKRFRDFITFIIIIAGLLVGAETYPVFMSTNGPYVHALDSLIIGIFVVEIAIRVGAYGSRPWNFFRDAWNTFDFVIVFVCILPIHAEFVAVFRLARVLRVLRLVSAVPKLQLLVGALLKSIPSIGYISLLLLLHFYIYACAGSFLFAENDPFHFGTLHQSMISLFQVCTLEGWNEIMNIQLHGSHIWEFSGVPINAPLPMGRPVIAPLFFISFILFGTMIVLNLFIGVIMNGMAEMQQEYNASQLQEKRDSQSLTISDEVHLLVEEVDTIKDQLSLIARRLELFSKDK